MIRYVSHSLALFALLAAGLTASVAQAEVASGSAPFIEPNGAYTGVKSFIVYADNDPANPVPGGPGELTYVYTITNDPGSFLGIIGFTLEVPLGSLVAVGSIDDGNPATPPPSAVTDVATANATGAIRWDWATATGLIDPGVVGDQLYVISAYSPGTVNDNVYGIEGEFAFDVTGTCVGPWSPPEMVGDANPCTIGFWKNRAQGKNGLLQFFPDGDFDQVVSAAVALSGGLFADEADLLAYLTSKGQRSIQDRGKQQLAATLLNLAAGDLFPDNTKCELYEGNSITSNACGDSLTVGDAVAASLVGIVGDETAQHEAHDCSDDINNGIGVVD